MVPRKKGVPALSELGVTKNESARAQKLAAPHHGKNSFLTDVSTRLTSS
jgi:hypothetical protein